MKVPSRSKVLFIIAVAAMSAPGCIFLPKPHVPHEKSAAEFGEVVSGGWRLGIRYCGSNEKYHFFSQGRYYYSLGIPTTPSSVVKFYRVPRDEMEVVGEFKRTWDMKKWTSLSDVGIDLAEKARLEGMSGNRWIETVTPDQ